MATTKIGPPLAGIRGTIGGIIYSENLSGTYARIWRKGANPRTPEQMVARGYMSRMPALWNSMTDVQRADWRTFAADPAQELTNPLGEDYYASGYNWFCKCSIRLLRVGRTPLLPVPSQARPAAPTIVEFRVTPAGTEVDQCTCGVATASSSAPANPPAQAFDNNLATTWATAPVNPTGWLRYDFCDPLVIRKYRLYMSNLYPTARPKDWTFEGLDNGGWDVLHTVTDWVFEDNEWATFYPKNAVAYDDYRINITANNGDLNQVIIWEMEMYLGVEDSSMIHYTEDDFENAPDYDLILHVSMGRSIGMSVQYPGFQETLALQGAHRHREQFQDELLANFGTITIERSWFARLFRQTTQGLRSAAATERTVTE